MPSSQVKEIIGLSLPDTKITIIKKTVHSHFTQNEGRIAVFLYSKEAVLQDLSSKETGIVEQQGNVPGMKITDRNTPKEAEFAVFRLFCSFVFGRIRKGESA